MKILVINSGSSSIKYSLFEMDSETVLADGLVGKIGEEESELKHRFQDKSGQEQKIEKMLKVDSHRTGLELIQDIMRESGVLTNLEELDGIGHRVVHGGEDFADPQIINDQVITSIKENIPLAPLHNPANLMGIEVTMIALPKVPQVAVFDTAFHQTLPPEAYHYALPYEYYDKYKIRRYGFHGTSHFCVTKKAAKMLGKAVDAVNLIVLHLGNGASACAVKNGKSIDTTMGMTPLAGLIMGTRCGDIDPGILLHLMSVTECSASELDKILNKQSGLKGVGGANDVRALLEQAKQGDERAKLALEMTCYRIKKYIGSYFAALNGVDAVVFTAGIGENAPEIRSKSCQNLTSLGIALDEQKNTTAINGAFEIQSNTSSVKILVIPTDEEQEIATATQSRILREFGTK